MEATFVFKKWQPEGKALDAPPPRFHIFCDFTTGSWQATVEGTATHVLDDGTRKSRPQVTHLGAAGGISWHGWSNENGANYFQVAIEGQEGNFLGIKPVVASAGYRHLERCLYPPFSVDLRQMLESGFPQEKIRKMLTFQSDQPSKAVPGARELVYALKFGNQTAAVSYCVDFSDGARSYESMTKVDGRIVERTTCADFKKIDGRWVAMTVTKYEASPAKKEAKQTGGSTVTIQKIKLNKSCDPRNIYFPVALGDQVQFPDERAIKVEDMAEFQARFEAFLRDNAEDDDKAKEKAQAPAKPAPKQP